MSTNSESNEKSGFQKIVDFFNSIKTNKPVSITEVVENTGLSWTYVKRVLKNDLKTDYCGFHFEKSGNTWIAWKDRDKIFKKLNDTCGQFLSEESDQE